MKFELTPDGFKEAGKPFFLLSGEMHYFRIKKRDWARHLEKAKRVQLDAITTYIPWSWHEVREGEFDLSGQKSPERDIAGFIDLAHEMGLKVVVKPGPYILAEYLDQGIPKRFLEKNPGVLVQNASGQPNIPFVCSLMHPDFLKHAAGWYDQIIPILKERQSTQGGPVVMMQICNEVGLQHWLAGVGDYNPETLKYYDRFLSEKYKAIEVLNSLYGENYSDFVYVVPPAGSTEKPGDIARYRDWHEFHRWYYCVYLKYLMEDLRKRGIEVPFYHNVPGWVFGRAIEFPVCLTLYSEVAGQCPDLLLGLDHIPENVDFRNFHDAAIITEMARSLQGRRLPLYSAEFQAGSREHCVRTYPNELELFYKAALAYGTQGWNYYMFSQGKNPAGGGVYGPTFYWDNALDSKGKEAPLYQTVGSLNQWIKANEGNLVSSKRVSRVGVAFYKPYYETEFFYPLFAKDRFFRPEKIGLRYDLKGIRDTFYFEGLLKALHILNCPPEIPDLQVQSLDELLKYELVWVFCLELMDEATQKKLVDFVARGGKAIFYPTLPKWDLEGRPCEVLRNGLGVREEGVFFPTDTKVQFFDLEPVNCLGMMNEFKVGDGMVDNIVQIGKKICGVEKKIGHGRATILGTIPNYQIEEHLNVFLKFLERDGIGPEIDSDNANVVTYLRRSQKGSFLFVLNFHPVEQKVKLNFKLGERKIRIPSEKRLTVPGTAGMILPLETLLGANNQLVYSTSEFLGCSEAEGVLRIKLRGFQGTRGEALLRLDRVPQKILLNGKETAWTRQDGDYLVQCRHGVKELILEVVG